MWAGGERQRKPEEHHRPNCPNCPTIEQRDKWDTVGHFLYLCNAFPSYWVVSCCFDLECFSLTVPLSSHFGTLEEINEIPDTKRSS